MRRPGIYEVRLLGEMIPGFYMPVLSCGYEGIPVVTVYLGGDVRGHLVAAFNS